MLLKLREALALSACGTVTASLAAHKSVNKKKKHSFPAAVEYCKKEFVGSLFKGLLEQIKDVVR